MTNMTVRGTNDGKIRSAFDNFIDVLDHSTCLLNKKYRDYDVGIDQKVSEYQK